MTVRPEHRDGYGEGGGEVGCAAAGNWEAQRWRVEICDVSESDREEEGEGRRRVAVRSVGVGGWLGLLAGGAGKVGLVEGREEWDFGWSDGVPGAAWWVCFFSSVLFIDFYFWARLLIFWVQASMLREGRRCVFVRFGGNG